MPEPPGANPDDIEWAGVEAFIALHGGNKREQDAFVQGYVAAVQGGRMEPPNVLTLARETRSSIEVTRNARGDYQWVAKAYFEEGHASEALHVLSQIDDELRARFLPEPDQ